VEWVEWVEWVAGRDVLMGPSGRSSPWTNEGTNDLEAISSLPAC
jgi:hypothetical protein